MSETRRETIERVLDEACNYYELFEKESDRGAAILAHALFEHRLRQAIKSRSDAVFAEKDFRISFRISTRIAFCLGLFGRETVAALDEIYRIRNEFAHSSEPLTFQHKLIAKRCSKLRLKHTSTPTDLRERYLVYLREVETRIRVAHPRNDH